MGLYKLCQHSGRQRDRCDDPWWGGYRRVRVSLSKWANREIHTKAEAAVVLEELRKSVREGTYDPRGLKRFEAAPVTFREFAEVYRERHIVANNLSRQRSFEWTVRPFLERFGNRALSEIRTADIQDLIADMRKPRVLNKRPGPRAPKPGTINRTVDLLRHMMNWAVGREYIERTPFKRGSETLIKKLRDDGARRRRLSEDEEAALLAVAPPYLRGMIIAALDTGMRRGEMLAVRFADVDMKRELITLRGETTKSKKTRVVPISTERLKTVLAWFRMDADGQERPTESRVFANQVGEPVHVQHRTWVTIVLKANGVTPKWSARLKYSGLSDDVQEAYRRIDLHWHDLRHEYASRLVERGVPLAQVRDLLGHASITTTERYDNQRLENLQSAVKKLERGLQFDRPQ